MPSTESEGLIRDDQEPAVGKPHEEWRPPATPGQVVDLLRLTRARVEPRDRVRGHRKVARIRPVATDEQQAPARKRGRAMAESRGCEPQTARASDGRRVY